MATTQMKELKAWLNELKPEEMSQEDDQWVVVHMIRACFAELEKATEELAGDVNHWKDKYYQTMAKNVNVWARYDRESLEHTAQYWFDQTQDQAKALGSAEKKIGQLEVALEKAQRNAKDWRVLYRHTDTSCANQWKERALAAELRIKILESALRDAGLLEESLESAKEKEDADLKSAGLLSSDII